MIEVKNITHSFGEKKVLAGINLCLAEGSVMGLVGINGAGKSTLLRIISGVYTADGGEVLFDGEPITEESAKAKLFFLPDDPYYTIYTTGDSLFELYKVFYPNIDRALFIEQLRAFGLSEKKPIRNFSKGMRRQLYVALALSIKPKYLLLDEAFDGLDPLARLAFKKAIIKAADEFGTSVLISSHSLRELEDFCDCYALIDNMTVASSGDISERVNRFCKFQLAFLDEVDEKLFDGLPIVSLEKTGRFFRVVLKCGEDTAREALAKLSPVVFEQMPMNFEEMFIHEVEKRGYMG